MLRAGAAAPGRGEHVSRGRIPAAIFAAARELIGNAEQYGVHDGFAVNALLDGMQVCDPRAPLAADRAAQGTCTHGAAEGRGPPRGSGCASRRCAAALSADGRAGALARSTPPGRQLHERAVAGTYRNPAFAPRAASSGLTRYRATPCEGTVALIVPPCLLLLPVHKFVVR